MYTRIIDLHRYKHYIYIGGNIPFYLFKNVLLPYAISMKVVGVLWRKQGYVGLGNVEVEGDVLSYGSGHAIPKIWTEETLWMRKEVPHERQNDVVCD